jgi:transcriptional regulator with XRE-family HTH domain
MAKKFSGKDGAAWLRAILKEKHLSQAKFAPMIGMTGPALSNILNGKRRMQIDEAAAIANAFMRPLTEVLAAFGLKYIFNKRLRLSGYVNAAEEVTIYDDSSSDFGLETIEVPFIGFAGTILAIRGDSAAPRYLNGEHIGISEHVPPSEQLGAEVVAKTTDDRVVLKRLQAAERDGTYTLVSLNPAFPPIQSVRLEWVSRVLLHFPAAGRRF